MCRPAKQQDLVLYSALNRVRASVSGRTLSIKSHRVQEKKLLRIMGMLWTKVNWLQSWTLIHEKVSHPNTERRGLKNDGKSKCLSWGPVEEGRGREKKVGKGRGKSCTKRSKGSMPLKTAQTIQTQAVMLTQHLTFAAVISISILSVGEKRISYVVCG